MAEILKCPNCGKEFEEGKGKRIYCSKECGKQYNNNYHKELMRSERKIRKGKRQENNLVEDNAEARKRDMSYGQYMAWKERGWIKEGEKKCTQGSRRKAKTK